MSKETKLGNYITKVNNYDIRMSVKYKVSNKGEIDKTNTSSHEFVLCRGGKVIVKGLKTKNEAVDKANSL